MDMSSLKKSLTCPLNLSTILSVMNTKTTQLRKELDTCSKCLNYLKLNNYDVNEAYYDEYEVLIDLCTEVFLDKSTKQN